MRVFFKRFVAASLGFLLVSCGDDAKDPITSTPTFSTVYEKVFVSGGGCGSCHVAGSVKGNEGTADFSTKALAYKNLVGKKIETSFPDWDITNCRDATLIDPSNAKGSVVAAIVSSKINDTFTGGCTPSYSIHAAFSGFPISEASATLLVDWINAGAKDN